MKSKITRKLVICRIMPYVLLRILIARNDLKAFLECIDSMSDSCYEHLVKNMIFYSTIQTEKSRRILLSTIAFQVRVCETKFFYRHEWTNIEILIDDAKYLFK